LVRDSALSLIARFIVPRPALEEKAFKQLLKCASDSSVAVQKKAIGYLKDIYLRDPRKNIKVIIATEFLRRTIDPEPSIVDLANKTLAEIWLAPLLNMLATGDESAHKEVAVENLKAQIVACVSHDTANFGPVLKDFLVWKVKDSKHAHEVKALYARIVKKLLDTANGSEAGPADLNTLVAFAEALPQTVVPGDLTSLKSYLKDLSKTDSIPRFTAVVTIFRCVLPHLSSTQSSLLEEVQMDLMKASQKLGRRQDLEDVMSCLASIDGVLHNTSKLVSYTMSLVQNLNQPQLSAQVKSFGQRKMEYEKEH
jgi:cohesin loading factor subunit SCC2